MGKEYHSGERREEEEGYFICSRNTDKVLRTASSVNNELQRCLQLEGIDIPCRNTEEHELHSSACREHDLQETFPERVQHSIQHDS